LDLRDEQTCSGLSRYGEPLSTFVVKAVDVGAIAATNNLIALEF